MRPKGRLELHLTLGARGPAPFRRRSGGYHHRFPDHGGPVETALCTPVLLGAGPPPSHRRPVAAVVAAANHDIGQRQNSRITPKLR